jgi:hypothetical protein
MTAEAEINETESNAQPPTFVALCGRVFRSDPEFFPQVEYRGETIYLCTEVCLDAFLSAPDRFIVSHRKSYKKKDGE